MSDDTARIRAALDDARGLAEALGLLDGRRGRDWQSQPGGVLVLCPWHDERSPSCSITLGSDGTVRVRCFGCNATGDGLSLVAVRHGLDLRREFCRVLEAAAAHAGVAPPQRLDRAPDWHHAPLRPIVRRAGAGEALEARGGDVDGIASALSDLAPVSADPVALGYLRSRGLARTCAASWWSLPADDAAREALRAAIIERVGLEAWQSSGLAAESGAWSWAWCGPRLVIPWCAPNGTVETLQGRYLGNAPGNARKYVFPRGRRPRWPWGVERLEETGDDTALALVEGAIDAVSMTALARRSGADVFALALPGVSAWDARWLRLFARRRCIVALDGDKAGERAVADVFARLAAVARRDDARRPLVTVRTPSRGKDWNDALCAATEAA